MSLAIVYRGPCRCSCKVHRWFCWVLPFFLCGTSWWPAPSLWSTSPNRCVQFPSSANKIYHENLKKECRKIETIIYFFGGFLCYLRFRNSSTIQEAREADWVYKRLGWTSYPQADVVLLVLAVSIVVLLLFQLTMLLLNNSQTCLSSAPLRVQLNKHKQRSHFILQV